VIPQVITSTASEHLPIEVTLAWRKGRRAIGRAFRPLIAFVMVLRSQQRFRFGLRPAV
jgi:hypothetical protein